MKHFFIVISFCLILFRVNAQSPIEVTSNTENFIYTSINELDSVIVTLESSAQQDQQITFYTYIDEQPLTLLMIVHRIRFHQSRLLCQEKALYK